MQKCFETNLTPYVGVLPRDISVWTDLTGVKIQYICLSHCREVMAARLCVVRAVILSVSLWACNSSIKIVLL